MPVSWRKFGTQDMTAVSKCLDPLGSGHIYWREFVHVLIYGLLPAKTGIPDPVALRDMLIAFIKADEASPTASSADVVEWNEYRDVPLWVDKCGVENGLARRIREIIWQLWADDPDGDGKGALHYIDLVMTLCTHPSQSFAESPERALGLHKAWVIACQLLERDDYMLGYEGIKKVFARDSPCVNPHVTIQGEDICEAILSEEEMERGLRIGFSEFSSRVYSITESASQIYTLKNVFDVLRRR